MTAVTGVRYFYKMTGRARPRTIVIAGLGQGLEMPAFRQTYRRAKIIGVEPLREHWRMIRRAGDRTPDVAIHGALWSRADETLTFHLNYEPDQRATVYELPTPIENELTREIRTTTLDAVYAEHGPWGDGLLWLDCEGAEREILAASQTLATAYRWINCELTFCPNRDVPSWQATDAALQAAGFRLLALHSLSRNGRQADGIYIRADEWSAVRLRTVANGIARKLERRESRSRRTARGRGGRS